MSGDAHDRFERPLSVDERLKLVEEAERREASAVRKAATGAWLSLILAAALLGVLVMGARWQLRTVRAQIGALEQEQSSLIANIEAQKAALADVEKRLQDRQAALSTLIGAVRRTDTRARGGLEVALDADPRATVLVPRAYVQIVDEGDRQWARNLGDRLQQGGVIPIGVAHVPRAASLQRFEVRYYKKEEEAGARRILTVLESAGVPAAPVYLNLESNTRVRANHFEIWCPANARAFKLRPLNSIR
jgi:hypothetical protein